MSKNIINLTPHTVVVKDHYGNSFTYPESGYVARSYSKYKQIGFLDGIPIQKETTPYLDFDGITINPNNDYIVSWQFAMKLKQVGFKNLERFLYPLSYKGIKDNGKVVSVPCLIRCN